MSVFKKKHEEGEKNMLECDKILPRYGRASGRKGDMERICLHSKMKG